MTVDSLIVAMVVLAIAFISSGMAVWLVASSRLLGALLCLAGTLLLASAVGTAAAPGGQLDSRPLYGAGLLALPLAVGAYPDLRWRNPVELLSLSTIALCGGFGVLYQGDVAGVMGLVIVSVLIAFVWWKIERADESSRLALLWLAFAVGFPTISGAYEGFVNPATANGAATAAAFTLVPISMAVGLIRPRVIDVRSLMVGFVVNVAAGLVVVALFMAFGSYLDMVRGQQPSLGTLAVVAALCAGGFQTARVILRGVIDQLLFGDRPDPLVAASHVGESIADDPVIALRAIRQALSLPYAALISGGKEVAASGTSVTNSRTIPLLLGTNEVGEIVVGLRAGELVLNKQDESVLRIVAPALAQAVHARGLAADLAESRGRAISDIEDERRRLRRDLHDGLGPTLTGVAYAADAARNVMANDPEAADALLAGLRADTASAIGEIRRLVDGLRPPALDQLGLVQAVRQKVGGMHTAAGELLTVTISAPDRMPELSAAAEVAAYRIAVEAVTNVARHARDGRVGVRFDVVGGSLLIEVTDHGRSTTWIPGVGMSSMRERAQEVGGTTTFSATSTGGKVTAMIPTALPS